MFKLNTPPSTARDLTVKIDGLLPRKDKFHIKFNYRAGGAGNPAFAAGLERIRHFDLVSARAADRIEDDAEHASFTMTTASERGRMWFGVIYDACVVSWETNILSDDEAILPTRENFIALAETSWPPSIGQAMVKLQAAAMMAADDDAKTDAALIKN